MRQKTVIFLFFLLLPLLCQAEPLNENKTSSLISDAILNKIVRACESVYPFSYRRCLSKRGEVSFEKGHIEMTAITREENISKAFQDFVKPGMRFLDLGSGDGRMVFLAAWLGARADGIEFERPLIRISNAARIKLQKDISMEQTHFVQGDFLKYDFSPYDVFYLEAGTDVLTELMQKLMQEMKPGSILISHHPDPEELALPHPPLIRTYPDKSGPVCVYRKEITTPGQKI